MTVYALVIYTGKETKLVLNEGKYSFKISDLARKMNWFFGINIITIIILITFMSQVGNRLWMKTNADEHYYLFPTNEKPIDKEQYTMRAMFSFWLLINTIVPLDLGVIYNLAKGIYTTKMIYDVEMFDVRRSEQEGQMIGCSVKNLTMIEDLSKVNNIFCDKTGTLTKNELMFRSIGFDSQSFEIKHQTKEAMTELKNCILNYYEKTEMKEKFVDLFRCICLCHEVV